MSAVAYQLKHRCKDDLIEVDKAPADFRADDISNRSTEEFARTGRRISNPPSHSGNSRNRSACPITCDPKAAEFREFGRSPKEHFRIYR